MLSARLGAEVAATFHLDTPTRGTCDIDIRNDSGLVGWGRRSFDLDEGTVKHEVLYIEDGFREDGFATRLTRNSWTTYHCQGIKCVYVTASDVGGGYAWAKIGFLPLTGEWNRIRGDVRTRFLTICGELSEQSRLILERILDCTDEEAIWVVADQEETVRGGIKLGRYLLSGLTWRGIFVLDDEDGLARFHGYLKVKGYD